MVPGSRNDTVQQAVGGVVTDTQRSEVLSIAEALLQLSHAMLLEQGHELERAGLRLLIGRLLKLSES